jgi:hypothetical protein
MFGKKFGLLILALQLVSCGQQSFENQITRRRLIEWLDGRQYQRVISFLNIEATPQEKSMFKDVLAEAHMGLGGFEILMIIKGLRSEPVFQREAFRAMSNDCPLTEIHSKHIKKLELRCGLVRLFNTLPDPDDPQLRHARHLWREILDDTQRRPNDAERLVALTLETSMLIARTGQILADYYDMSKTAVTSEQVDKIFLQIQEMALDAQSWIENVQLSADPLNIRFFGNEESELFRRNFGPKLEFATKTGIPKLLEIADMKNDGVRERGFRATIVHELDLVLTDYFKVKLDE